MENQALWVSFLTEVTSSPAKHYVWLRSLSYLEYIGYRKMVKALDYHQVQKGVFHHLTDEIQHSFMLKELAEKGFLHEDHLPPFSEEFKNIAEAYFQDIDGEVQEWVTEKTGKKNSLLCYMLVSFLIEKRAMKVYPPYLYYLKEIPPKYIIQKIIKDESEHLSYLEDKIQTLPEYSIFKESLLEDFEETCFTRYLVEMKRCFEMGSRLV